ncbi:unnamed protein product [Caenorhabditis auriculariae]|uniref:Complex 1 LYR protein domain-containing protein n=1 Tax=Caenorhabditis auriculariae TaxID=2777116 RepID=A0A8S1HJ79_9PELO|nr:unnamed protein product [Caenorhabditis auriculariae]
MALRQRVVDLYKTLHHMGKEYPKGAKWFHERLKGAFLKNKDEKDPKKIEDLLLRGNFVVKEIDALYKLRKYRAMKQRYYEEEPFGSRKRAPSKLDLENSKRTSRTISSDHFSGVNALKGSLEMLRNVRKKYPKKEREGGEAKEEKRNISDRIWNGSMRCVCN